MESIQEKSGVDSNEAFPMESTKDNGAMDSLTVPEINGNKKKGEEKCPQGKIRFQPENLKECPKHQNHQQGQTAHSEDHQGGPASMV